MLKKTRFQQLVGLLGTVYGIQFNLAHVKVFFLKIVIFRSCLVSAKNHVFSCNPGGVGGI